MNLDSLLWGLMMMGVGMGTVFALLLLLMMVLMGIGRLDRRPTLSPSRDEAPALAEPVALADGDQPGPPSVRVIADGLDEDQVAAITVAVITHAENRRRLAAPETRAFKPGSQLFASRWLTVGRGRQTMRS